MYTFKEEIKQWMLEVIFPHLVSPATVEREMLVTGKGGRMFWHGAVWTVILITAGFIIGMLM